MYHVNDVCEHYPLLCLKLYSLLLYYDFLASFGHQPLISQAFPSEMRELGQGPHWLGFIFICSNLNGLWPCDFQISPSHDAVGLQIMVFRQMPTLSRQPHVCFLNFVPLISFSCFIACLLLLNAHTHTSTKTPEQNIQKRPLVYLFYQSFITHNFFQTKTKTVFSQRSFVKRFKLPSQVARVSNSFWLSLVMNSVDQRASC